MKLEVGSWKNASLAIRMGSRVRLEKFRMDIEPARAVCVDRKRPFDRSHVSLARFDQRIDGAEQVDFESRNAMLLDDVARHLEFAILYDSLQIRSR